MRILKPALLIFTIVSLLAIFGVRAEAGLGDYDCGELLDYKAYKDCIMQARQSMRQLQMAAEAKKEKPPAWVGEPIVPRPYGYWIGDLTELSYVMEFKPGVETDFSWLPGIGAKVGEYIVRSRTLYEERLASGSRKVIIKFTVQNYAVLCKQQYVPFGPFEVLWRTNAGEEWKRLAVPAAKILISPISLCDETPDVKMAPKDMMVFSRANSAGIMLGAGILAIIAALVIGVRGLREMYARYETSPLWKARKILAGENIGLMDAIGAYRSALREKFGVSGADDKEAVRDRFRELPFWLPYAEEAALLWEETTEVLYEERVPDEKFVERIRSFINKLSRREVDE